MSPPTCTFVVCTRQQKLCLFAKFEGKKEPQIPMNFLFERLIQDGKEGRFMNVLTILNLIINICHKTHFYVKNASIHRYISPCLPSTGKPDWNIKFFLLDFNSWQVFQSLGEKFEANRWILTEWLSNKVGKETQIVEQAVTVSPTGVPNSVLQYDIPVVGFDHPLRFSSSIYTKQNGWRCCTQGQEGYQA